MEDPVIPQIPGFNLIKKVGAGGFGEVFYAEQDVLEREVAIKIILPIHANQEEFIDRFESEARLIAQLAHPYIVPLYQFGRTLEGAYLVMRWLSGGDLANSLLLEGPWEPERAADMLDNIASALHFAHRKKVVHQDIKPANIMLDAEGVAYLTDFGIARILDTDFNLAQDPDQVMHGSPKYISPEHLKRLEITEKSDIYSLGLLMYEVLTGEPPFEAEELLQLLQKQLREDLPPLQDLMPDLPVALNEPLRQATAKAAIARFDTTIEFAQAFRTALIAAQEGATHTSIPSQMTKLREKDLGLDVEILNPYKGLSAFVESDADNFFGRNKLIERLESRLVVSDDNASRLLAVVGPSGSGKSSVIRAGLLPRIRGGEIEGLPQLFVTSMKPGKNPMRGLEGALLNVASRLDDTLMKQLGQERFDFGSMLDYAVAPGREVLLLIDQFEEVFTLVEDANLRRFFLDSLYEALMRHDSRLRIIITMRADFIGKLLEYSAWGELVQDRSELVPAMTPEELHEAIVMPATNAGLQFEDGLPGIIVADVNEEIGSLPLLQYALTELFNRRDETDPLMLKRQAYVDMGGIAGALAKTAEQIYQGLSPQHQRATALILPRLVKLGEGTGDTRQRVLVRDIYSLDIDRTIASETLSAYQKQHLLTSDSEPMENAPTVEVAHEALIRQWGQLRKWLDDNRAALHIQSQLSSEMRQWTTADKSDDFLARGVRLAQFEALLANENIALSLNEREYIEASVALETANQRRRQRTRNFIAALAVVASIAAIFAGFAWRDASNQRDIAEDERENAQNQAQIAQSSALGASALLLVDSQPDLAALLSVAAFEVRETYDALNSVLITEQSQRQLVGYFNGHTSEVRTVAYHEELGLLATGALDGEIIVWDATSHTLKSRLSAHLERVNDIAFKPGGGQLASVGSDGVLIMWDVETGICSNVYELLPDADEEAFIGCEKLSELDLPDTGDFAAGWSVAYSPTDSILVVGDDLGRIHVLDFEEGDVVDIIQAHDGEVFSLAYSPDGNMLASGGGDSIVKLWDSPEMRERVSLAEHSNWVLTLAFSPDGRFLASSGPDMRVLIWDVVAEELAGERPGHRGWVRALAFTEGGDHLISADELGTIIDWPLFDDPRPTSFRSPEDTRVWDIALSGSSLYVVGETDSVFEMVLREQPTFPFERLVGHVDQQIEAITVFSDGTTVAAAGGAEDDYAIRLWDIESGELLDTQEGHSDRVTDMAYSEGRLVSVSADNTAVIWEADGETTTLQAETALFSVAVRGDVLALGDASGNITMWHRNATSGEWEADAVLEEHEQRVFSLDIDPDGKRLASADFAGKVLLWDIVKHEVITSLEGHSGGVEVVRFSPDGQILATGGRDQTIRIWDVNQGQQIGEPLTGHVNFVMDIAFSPDGKLMTSSSADQSILFWDVETLRQIGLPLVAHANRVMAIDMSEDGHFLLSGGWDGNVIVWDMSIDDWLDSLCEFANRGLTTSEIQRYLPESDVSERVCGVLRN